MKTNKLKFKAAVLLLIVCFVQAISCAAAPLETVYAKDQTAGLSKKKLKSLKKSLTDIQALSDFNYKTADYAYMISFVMNVEHAEFMESSYSSYDYEEHMRRIKTKTMDNYLKRKFHLKKPKKKIDNGTTGLYGICWVFEKKGYYYVQGADGEAVRKVRLISVKKLSEKKYEVLYDRFILIEDQTYEETLKAVVSYSSKLKAWTFYKITSQGALSGHPKKSYLKI